MVQAEVADRLAARPGLQDLRRPVGQGRLVRRRTPRRAPSGRNVFWPAPNVDSGLVAWTRRDPPATTATREQVFAVVDAAFAQRRKTLRGALRGLAGSGEAAADGADPRPASTRSPAARSLAVERLRPDRRGAARHDVAPTAASPCARPPRSTCTSASARRARTASTRSPPSTRRSGSTTTSRVDRRRRAGRSSPRRDVRRRDGACPPTGDNIVDRGRRLLAAHHGVDGRGRRSRIDKAIPVAGGHGRRLGRRGRRPGRPRPALGRSAPPTTTCSTLAARARQRRAVRAARRHRARHRPRRAGRRRSPTRAPGGGWWCRPPTGCRRRRSTATSTRCSPTRPADAGRAGAACSPRWRTGDPRRLGRARSTTTSRRRRSTCAPSSATLIARGRGRGRAARRWCPGSGPDRACSCASPATTPAPGRARSRPPAHRASCSSPTARSPAPHVVRVGADGQPAQPRAGLQGVRRPPAAHRRLPRHRRRASGSASSAATATARPRCSR